LAVAGGTGDLTDLAGAQHELLKWLATLGTHKLKNGHVQLRVIR